MYRHADLLAAADADLAGLGDRDVGRFLRDLQAHLGLRQVDLRLVHLEVDRHHEEDDQQKGDVRHRSGRNPLILDRSYSETHDRSSVAAARTVS